jgi:glycosyltransferase involved in cell wall biosynthesis
MYPGGDYMVLVVDDGSSEPVNIGDIRGKLHEPKPIFVLRSENNLGITATLNKGLSWIEKNTNAKYIARLDCGDRCMPERFEKQVGLMNLHPALVLTGSWCRIIEEKSSFSYSYKGPAEHEAIQKAMYTKNVFMHATVMFRVSVLGKVGYYPTNFEYAEDYAFFWKLINAGQSAMIQEFLVMCELNKSGISYKNKSKQLLARGRVIKTFGKGIVLKFVAYMRLLLLFVLPKQITLQLKKWKG